MKPLPIKFCFLLTLFLATLFCSGPVKGQDYPVVQEKQPDGTEKIISSVPSTERGPFSTEQPGTKKWDRGAGYPQEIETDILEPSARGQLPMGDTRIQR
jgi:hypothetical protein